MTQNNKISKELNVTADWISMAATKKRILQLHKTSVVINAAMNEELDKMVLADHFQQMVDDSPGDLSARYWLMQFLEPLNRKEIKSVVDGFLVQLLNEDQAKKLVKFLAVRFPNYYNTERSEDDRFMEDEEENSKVTF